MRASRTFDLLRCGAQNYLSMRRFLPFLIVGFVALVTIASGVVLYRSHLPVGLTESQESSDREEDKEAHIRGAEHASVALEEFGDFQCPPCGMLAGPIKQIEEENGSNLRVVFRHFPF